MPKFFSYTTFQQTGFFYDMLNAIRYAQKLAVATSCNVQVAITANQYTLTRPSARTYCTSMAAANFTQAVTRPGSGETSYQGSLSGVTLSSATFYFMAKGNASGAYTLTVGTHQISIVPDTGYVYGQ
jgi:MSHA pilin protein MshC